MAMDELSSYELCLLISLCYKQGKKAYRGIKPVRQEEHYRSWSELANTVNDYCEKSVITVSIDNTDNNASYQIPPKPTIILEDKFLLEEFLDDYCNSFENGKLKLYNSDRISHQELLAQFRESIDKTKVINEYYIEEIKYIPIILWGLRKGFIKFIDIDYSLYSNKNQLKNVPYIKLNKRKYNQGVLDFGIMLDLSEFMELEATKYNDNNNKEVTSDKSAVKKKGRRAAYRTPREKQFHLQRQQWGIWFCTDLQVRSLIKEAKYSDEYINIGYKLFEESGVFEETTQPRKAITEFNKKVWVDVFGEKDDVVELIAPRGNKYQVNINLYRKFKNMLEGDGREELLVKSKDKQQKEYNKIALMYNYLKNIQK